MKIGGCSRNRRFHKEGYARSQGPARITGGGRARTRIIEKKSHLKRLGGRDVAGQQDAGKQAQFSRERETEVFPPSLSCNHFVEHTWNC